MDYEFRKNSLDGSFYCQCSMGHEIIGRWLQEEIGSEKKQLRQIIQLIKNAKSEPVKEHYFPGREMSVTICEDEVVVQDNSIIYSEVANHYEDEFDENEFEFYESESCASCGIEDFERLILQWADFTR